MGLGDVYKRQILCRWLGNLTYITFMFFVVVVLQSLLIAQMSDTFTNIQCDAKRARLVNRARSIVNVEKTAYATRMSWIYKVCFIRQSQENLQLRLTSCSMIVPVQTNYLVYLTHRS